MSLCLYITNTDGATQSIYLKVTSKSAINLCQSVSHAVCFTCFMSCFNRSVIFPICKCLIPSLCHLLGDK